LSIELTEQGFDNYLKPPNTNVSKKKQDVTENDRLFSTSSATYLAVSRRTALQALSSADQSLPDLLHTLDNDIHIQSAPDFPPVSRCFLRYITLACVTLRHINTSANIHTTDGTLQSLEAKARHDNAYVAGRK
jgi:hypothetical protein